jgi:hypothetical protein
MKCLMRMVSCAFLVTACFSPGIVAAVEPVKKQMPAKITVTFPLGAATPSEVCGECHKAIYREHSHGFGSDNPAMKIMSTATKKSGDGPSFAATPKGSSHALAGVDSFPQHSRDVEEGGKSCNTCHFPQPFILPELDVPDVVKPSPRKKAEEFGGLTCASCHLTQDGKVRAPYNLRAPHENFPDARMKTSVMCATCHSLGKRVVGKQTQTYLEWRDDYWKKGLGFNCQYCHMPRTNRPLSEEYDLPDRVASRHLWTGGRSLQRLQSALSQAVVQPVPGTANFEVHLINIGAGHSVPTGSNRRGVYLQAEVEDAQGKVAARQEWLFAPWYGDRPDDKAFLEEDRTRPDAVAAMQADAQGPHETVIRAGEERILRWSPPLKPGTYTITTRLVYDLNRYDNRVNRDDQTLLGVCKTVVTVTK